MRQARCDARVGRPSAATHESENAMTTAAIRRAGLALFTAFAVAGLFASTSESQDKPAKPAKHETVKGSEAASGEVIVRFADAPAPDLVDFLRTSLDADEFRK